MSSETIVAAVPVLSSSSGLASSLCCHCGHSEGGAVTWRVGNPPHTAHAHRDCWTCQHKGCRSSLDLLTYWWDPDEYRGYCIKHRPREGAQLGGGAVVSRGVRTMRGSLPVGSDLVLGQLAAATAETERAFHEIDQLRTLLQNARKPLPAEASNHNNNNNHTNGSNHILLQPGDRVDSVVVRTAEGSRAERKLVGICGALRLLETLDLNGVPLWSVAAGQLRSLSGTVGPVANHPFHLVFEGPHSELQVWCNTVELMDAWLAWGATFHPDAKISRDPKTLDDGGLWRATDVKKKKGSNLRQLMVRTRSQQALVPAKDGEGAAADRPMLSPPSGATAPLRQISSDLLSPRTSVSSNSTTGGDSTTSSQQQATMPPSPLDIRKEDTVSSPPGAAGDAKSKISFAKWAKKLYQKAGDAMHIEKKAGSSSGGSSPGQDGKIVDVFTCSLDETMEEQLQVIPELKVPLLLKLLCEEVLRCDGQRTEGIFRISASHAELAELVQTIKRTRNFEYKLPAFKDAHIPAGLMKQWLREQPTPLFDNYDRCLELTKFQHGSSEESEAFKDIVMSLSEVHRNVVLFLVDFLILVGDPSNVPFTKMPLANLALVFVPSFLRCPSHDVATMLMNQPAEQAFVQTLVEYFEKKDWRDGVLAALNLSEQPQQGGEDVLP